MTISVCNYLEEAGFNSEDAPFSPIRLEWNSFPIIKCIRQWEKETGHTYCRPNPSIEAET